jgi:hypothetical protein
MSCQHSRKAYGKVLYGEAGLFHVAEFCPDCKKQLRPGWVGKDELDLLGVDRDELPVFRDLRPGARAGDQPSLFGGMA